MGVAETMRIEAGLVKTNGMTGASEVAGDVATVRAVKFAAAAGRRRWHGREQIRRQIPSVHMGVPPAGEPDSSVRAERG